MSKLTNLTNRSYDVIRLAIIIGLLLLLEWICRIGGVQPHVMVPPSVMLTTLWKLLQSDSMVADICLTFGAAFNALAVAVLLGMSLGWLMYRSQRLKDVLYPLLASWYSIPVFALYPMLIAFMGLNQRPVIAIGVLMAFATMALNTLIGLQNIPVVMIKSARAMGIQAVPFLWHVQLPAALPSLMTGLKLTATYSFIGVIMAEFILSPNGLGHAISYAYNDFDTRTMYALMLLVIFVSASVQWVLIQIERRVLAYRSTLGGL
jgi:NitT/TauT family transport system permease protein